MVMVVSYFKCKVCHVLIVIFSVSGVIFGIKFPM